MRKTEGKVKLGRPQRRWDNAKKMDFQDVRCRGMYWVEMSHVRGRWQAHVKAEINIGVQKML